jgi:hypothetical protein
METYLLIISDEKNIQCIYINKKQKEIIEELPKLKKILERENIKINFIPHYETKSLMTKDGEKDRLLTYKNPFDSVEKKINNQQKAIIDYLNYNYGSIFFDWGVSFEIN